MKPVFLDTHIHTSSDPDNLDANYSVTNLAEAIKEFTKDSTYLISLTDHNTINKASYLKAKDLGLNILLGVELHIRNYADCPAYHCHIYFRSEMTEEVIDDLNVILDSLYPQKVVNKLDPKLPNIQDITNGFDDYDFLLLPHGGQSHCTFDTSIPTGVKFDNTMERSIYYNQFDGFTARGDKGLERTQDYFEKLGINEFVNLLTCTDNYNPAVYPQAKSSKAKPFVPTWMFAMPTFDGLRLSLSERSRLVYSNDKPSVWSEHIKSVSLKNEHTDIKVTLTSGLNVVIGGSSSGKTLFVDSLQRRITDKFDGTKYDSFDVQSLKVDNPSGVFPHYLSQNYIMSIVADSTEDSMEKIEIIKRVFPGDSAIRELALKALSTLKDDLGELVDSLRVIQSKEQEMSRIPFFSRLITSKKVKTNVLSKLLPSKNVTDSIDYSTDEYEEAEDYLLSLDDFLTNHLLLEHNVDLIPQLLAELSEAATTSRKEKEIRTVIKRKKQDYDKELKDSDNEDQTKKQQLDHLLSCVKEYSLAYLTFKKTLERVSNYSVTCESEVIESMGHKLYIENSFQLDKTKFLEAVNHLLKSSRKVSSFDQLTPESMFDTNYKGQLPNVRDYDDFERRVYQQFEKLNTKKYKIETEDGRDFENLSAGWRTSIILDLILGFDGDLAPIIIDQPEDNLATSYINSGLVRAIKKIKSKKQVILVSHNATIPMLADAQNIVLCRNIDNVITVRSNRLEGAIEGKSILDYVAEITDGGKSSIKKRVKKYNLKKFKTEDNEASIS